MPKAAKKTPRRREAARLTTLTELANVGLGIINQEGVDALTMRRLASDLGLGAMTLYSYVRTKEELFDVIALQVLGAIGGGMPSDQNWEARLAVTISQLHVTLHEHPGVAKLILSRPAPIPALDPFREAILSILHDAGFPIQDAVDALTALVTYVMGYTIVENARNEAQLAKESLRLARLSRYEFPHLSAAAEIYATHVSQRTFDAGLKSLIDGLASELKDKRKKNKKTQSPTLSKKASNASRRGTLDSGYNGN